MFASINEQDKVQLEPLHFTVEAGIVHRLGEESVSDEVLAVVELVKNSYDDDAENVKLSLKNIRTGASTITIADDGNGMSEEDLKSRWMRIATSIKTREPISPKFKRHRLGQKGVGRFAVENLSKKTVLTSYPLGSSDGYEIMFNWDEYKIGMDIQEVKNSFYKFKKDPALHGLQIRLTDLRKRWSEQQVKSLQSFLKALAPPAVSTPNFKINVETDEFAELSGTIDSEFLNKAILHFQASLAKTGEVKYSLTSIKGAKKEKSEKITDFCCGPIDFKLWFYYREKKRMQSLGATFNDFQDMLNIIDDYGGIKLYRDGIRLSGFGNPDDDWTGLDSLRTDPTVNPAKNQIIASVEISSKDNPEITETTTRENLIKNKPFQDMLEFIHTSIAVFSELRGEIEGKRQPGPKKDSAYIKKAQERLKANKDRKELLDFSGHYPTGLTFYGKLEEEINICYLNSLPNATMVLSRKLIENLVYEALYTKYPKDIELRYYIKKGRALDFSILLENLESKMPDFKNEQRDLLSKLLELIKPFRTAANGKAHNIMDYLGTIEDLDKQKIPEIIDVALKLIQNIKATS
ncbi:MAG: ATP-binding protein [Candidatus Bathyarchaeia archaeon]|jgi:hypothetical protein